MFVVDTNILVYAANEASPFHSRCARVLDEARRQPSAWYLTWGICYEFLRATTHPRVFTAPWTLGRAWSFLEALFASRSLSLLVETERHSAVAAQMFAEAPHLSGNLLHDGHTAILMREHGIRRIYTRDNDFYRFKFVEPIDPTEEPA